MKRAILTYLHEGLSLFGLRSGAPRRHASVSPVLQRHGTGLPVYQVSGRIVFRVVTSIGTARAKICLTVGWLLIFRAACCRIFFV